MYKVAVWNYDDYIPRVDDVAVFESLRKLYEYVDMQIKSSGNKYKWDDFVVTEIKNRKWYERWIDGKRVQKRYESILSWSQICHWLDNHMVK